MKEIIVLCILGACGLFAVLGGALNWNFFMESRKAAFFVKIFGRTGARIFYIILGLALVGFAIYAGFNPEVMQNSRVMRNL